MLAIVFVYYRIVTKQIKQRQVREFGNNIWYNTYVGDE